MPEERLIGIGEIARHLHHLRLVRCGVIPAIFTVRLNQFDPQRCYCFACSSAAIF